MLHIDTVVVVRTALNSIERLSNCPYREVPCTPSVARIEGGGEFLGRAILIRARLCTYTYTAVGFAQVGGKSTG